MKALILVGGYGTRLRPLTINFPKSAFPFINEPLVQHQIKALAQVGVKEVVIAINYQADHIKKTLDPLQQKYKIKITYSQQTEAMGTAGPLKLAQQILRNDNPQGLFFTFNSDIICDFPLQDMIDSHRQHKKQGTMVLTEVVDPRRFGVLVTREDGHIESYVQKPQHFISNKINAGIYLLNVSVLDRIPLRHCMLQAETFPALVNEGQLHGLTLKDKFWFDTGKPQDYLLAQNAYMNYYKITEEKHGEGVIIGENTTVEEGASLGPNVVIGANCKIGPGCRLKNCTILQGTTIGKGTYIEGSIISWRCKIGNWVRIEGLSCIAQEVAIKDQTRISQCMVLSHKNINGIHQKTILL